MLYYVYYLKKNDPFMARDQNHTIFERTLLKYQISLFLEKKKN